MFGAAPHAADARVNTVTPRRNPSFAGVSIGESSGDDEERRVDDGISVEHPRERAEILCVEVDGDLGQRDVDDEQVDARKDHAGTDDRKHLGRRCGAPAPRILTKKRHSQNVPDDFW